MSSDDNGLRKTIGYANKFWKDKSQKGMTDEQKLQEFHKDEHAARYGARTSKYKRGSAELGWKIVARTDLKAEKQYKWGSLKDLHPPNLANPLTCKVPSLIDFIDTRQPKFFFYTLKNWDFAKEKDLPVETNIIYKALMYWRLMLFTGDLDEKQKKIVKYYLDTCNRIISARMPMFEFWPYGNGLAHYYNYKREDTYKDRNKESNFITFNPECPHIFFNLFDSIRAQLSSYSREIEEEKVLKNKEKYWTKIFKTIFEKSQIPNQTALRTNFNYQNLDLVVSSYIAWAHNRLKPDKKEPKIKIVATWKSIYSIYKEIEVLKSKSPELFQIEEIAVEKVDYESTLGAPIYTVWTKKNFGL
ncbi:MAG: hypothetical protein VX343_02525 [Thermodesulfobacteriota bacterium]|nr:hypothetical protein [Thermodesulfobacteriota bacterium]|tara:strand:- start:11380 stop:12453 length:1074 start_codon:yes stop_codon:yes gene_type:complete